MNQLMEEVEAFIEKTNGKTIAGPDTKKILFDLWYRMTGEKIFCTSCGKRVSSTFENLKATHERRKRDINLELINGKPIFVEEPKKRKKISRKKK